MTATHDAIVIGGGPAGSTAALLLAEAGWHVAIVEHARFPRRKVCGEYISASTWPVLDRLGVVARLAAIAGPEVTHVGLYAGSSTRSARLGSSSGQSCDAGRAVGRAHLDTALLQRAAECGAEVLQPWTLASANRGHDGIYECVIVDRETNATSALRAGIVIAAHGSWEPAPLPTQAARHPARDADLLGFKAHFARGSLPRGLMPLLAFPGGYGGMVHTDGGRISLSCCIRRDALAQCRARSPGLPAGAVVLAHIAGSCAGVADALDNATIDDRWIAAGPLSTGIRGFGNGGIFAVGNAAAEAHPVIAEGISMAIQSSALLAAQLIDATPDITGSEDALRALRAQYEHAWRANFAVRLQASALFAHLFMRPLPTRLATLIVGAIPQLLTEGARWSGKSSQMSARGALLGDAR